MKSQLDNRSILRGKSGLHWTRRQVTPGRRKFTESATENKPPSRVRVKRCGKSIPRVR